MTVQVFALVLCRRDTESSSALLDTCEVLLVALLDLMRFAFLLLLLMQASVAM